MAMSVASAVFEILILRRCNNGPRAQGRRARPRTLLFSAVQRENLVEDDGARGCGADPAHREAAEFEGEVAGPRSKRGCGGDQISWVGEIYVVLYPDRACHGCYQAKQHDREATDEGTRD